MKLSAILSETEPPLRLWLVNNEDRQHGLVWSSPWRWLRDWTTVGESKLPTIAPRDTEIRFEDARWVIETQANVTGLIVADDGGHVIGYWKRSDGVLLFPDDSITADNLVLKDG